MRGDKPFNITQLAVAMGKARESVSRRVNDKISMTGEYPQLFADALEISVEELRPPAVEPVSLASLAARLAALEAEVAKLPTQEDLTRGLDTLRAAIDARANPSKRTGSGESA